MERTQIYLTDEEADVLDRVAAERSVTRSHLIREAVDATYVRPHASRRDRLLATLEELGPPWQGRDDLPDGEAYVEQARGVPLSGPVARRRRPGSRAGARPAGPSRAG